MWQTSTQIRGKSCPKHPHFRAYMRKITEFHHFGNFIGFVVNSFVSPVVHNRKENGKQSRKWIIMSIFIYLFGISAFGIFVKIFFPCEWNAHYMYVCDPLSPRFLYTFFLLLNYRGIRKSDLFLPLLIKKQTNKKRQSSCIFLSFIFIYLFFSAWLKPWIELNWINSELTK